MAALLENISTLIIQESDLLLGAVPLFEWIEDSLRQKVYLKPTDQEQLNNLVHSVEDAISELVILSDNRWKTYALLQYYMAFVGSQPKDLFFIMLVMHLIDYFKFVQKLSNICQSTIELVDCGGAFEAFPPPMSNTIISEAMTRCEALAAENKISSSVKKQAKWLCDKFNAFHNFLKDVEIGKLNKEEVAWIDEVFDVCYSANVIATNFLESPQPLRKKWLFRACLTLHSPEKLADKLSKISEQVQNVADRKPRLISTPVLQSGNVRSLTLASTAERLDVVSFDEDVDAIIEKLLVEDTRCITISILGIPGIGKTSLARLVYTSDAVVHRFPLRLWVSGATEMEIMQQILGIGGCLDHDQIIRLTNTVFADKRFLIIVDNSCASSFWGQMKDVFKNLSNGSRIIFTVCSSEEAPPISKRNFNYRLHLRSDDESWALFKHALKRNISLQLQEDLKSQILRICGGLPKVIVTLAGSLSRRDPTFGERSGVIKQLNPDEESWLQILDQINKHLPLHLRRCLFYFGLFPADYRIPARRLMNLWVAEGLVQKKADGTSVERVAEQCLEELANFGMVHVTERKLNRKIKTCSLPEALRSHWLNKAKEINFLQGHSNITYGMRHLADHVNPDDAIFKHIHGNDSTSLYPWYKSSVSFLSFDRSEDAGKYVGNFLERCISRNFFFYLLVLDLETVFQPRLPNSLSKLTHLRYLGLRSTQLHCLPKFINKLLRLQTLDLKRTCITTLPTSIWRMIHLRHLFLEQSHCTIFLPPLQKSYLEDIQTLWGLFVDEHSPVKNGLDKLQSIKKLGLQSKVSMASQKDAMSSQLEALKNWVMKIKHLQKLRLKSFDEQHKPWDLHLDSLLDHTDLSSLYLLGKLKNRQLVTKLPQNLIELTLSASGLVDDPMQALSKLPNLKILRLYAKSYTGKRIVCSSGGFPKLKVLKLWELEHLEAWYVEEGSFPHLKDLEIRRCKELKMLPDGLKSIKTLRKVKLTQLPWVSPKVRDRSGEDRIKIAHVLDVCIED